MLSETESNTKCKCKHTKTKRNTSKDFKYYSNRFRYLTKYRL
jgi:hypothetical protein